MQAFNPGKMITMSVVTLILCLLLAVSAHFVFAGMVTWSITEWLRVMFLLQAALGVNKALASLSETFDKMIALAQEKQVPPPVLDK